MNTSSILYTVHTFLRAAVHPGDIVVDATAGNGYDTLFLADCVGRDGVVYAFDIQAAAVAATNTVISACNADVRVLHAGHHEMLSHIDAIHIGRVKAVVFNLGYLPGGDKGMVTQADTTLQGIEQALEVLCADGSLIVVCYMHDDGRTEYEQVRTWLTNLPQQRASVLECNFRNQVGNPPMAFVVTKQPHQKERS